MTFQEFLDIQILSIGDYQLSVARLSVALAILIGTRFLYIGIARLLKRRFSKRESTDLGRLYAFRQITKYILYVLGILFALQALGVQLSVIWAGAAALLVGFGLGMQQTFNDLMSGVILLLEGTVEVGDVVIIEDMPGKVTEIGIRTSKVLTLNEDFILVPNSKLVVENIHNLSYNEEPTRFQVSVGVAYASDIELVRDILIKAANAHPDVVQDPEPKVHFTDFGDSSLDFVLHFYTREYLVVPRIKSEIRFNINQLFKEAEVEIPFPQRVVWMNNK